MAVHHKYVVVTRKQFDAYRREFESGSDMLNPNTRYRSGLSSRTYQTIQQDYDNLEAAYSNTSYSPNWLSFGFILILEFLFFVGVAALIRSLIRTFLY